MKQTRTQKKPTKPQPETESNNKQHYATRSNRKATNCNKKATRSNRSSVACAIFTFEILLISFVFAGPPIYLSVCSLPTVLKRENKTVKKYK